MRKFLWTDLITFIILLIIYSILKLSITLNNINNHNIHYSFIMIKRVLNTKMFRTNILQSIVAINSRNQFKNKNEFK